MPLRILFVDDNIDAAESLRMLLTLRGYQVCSVHLGEPALALVGEFRPHVVILDLAMPGPDGFRVAEQLRESPVVLVALTGYELPEDRRRSMQEGFHHHLLKPVDPDDLVALLTVIGGEHAPS